MNQSKEMARIAYNALSDKKGEDIKIIDITGISVLADCKSSFISGFKIRVFSTTYNKATFKALISDY